MIPRIAEHRLDETEYRGHWRHAHFFTVDDILAARPPKSAQKYWDYHGDDIDAKCKTQSARFKCGWPEGLAQAREALKALKRPQMPDQRMRYRTGLDRGDELDVHRVNMGDYDRAWSGPVRRRIPTLPKAVRLICEVTLHGGHGADEAFWRGASVVAICDMLEHAGIPCEVWAFSSGSSARGHNLHTMASVCVHNPDEPLNLERIASLAHEEMERGIMFRALSCIRGAQGIGGCWPWGLPLEDTDILVDQVFSAEAAQRKINEVLDGVRAKVNLWAGTYGGINAAWDNGWDVMKEDDVTAESKR